VAARLLPLDAAQARHALGTAEYHGTIRLFDLAVSLETLADLTPIIAVLRDG
jgi:hypothetical protein